MATRTINLKMILNRKEGGHNLRRALWTTHEEINKAVAEIERILLLCRGKAYWTWNENCEEVQVPESEVVERSLKMAREAQRRNGNPFNGTDEEVLSAMRELYEAMVPSCQTDNKGNPLKGDAQSIGNSYAGPLLDKDTCKLRNANDINSGGPFLETASKVFPELPDWIQIIEKDSFDQNDKTEFLKHRDRYFKINLKEANSWYGSEEITNIVNDNKAFNKDGWKKKADNKDNGWAVDFAKKQLQLKEDNRISIREKLWKEMRLLPFGDLFFDKNSVGNLWNRLAVRLAVAHLLSWESWNHTTFNEHNRVSEALEKAREEAKANKDLIEELKKYEKERHIELRKVAETDDDNPYKIGNRAVRAWDRVLERWRKEGNTELERRKILDELQTKLRGKFGDPALFNWLAEDGRQDLWKNKDSLPVLVKLNNLERLLERKKKYALYTTADARLHPRWACYEAPGGSNLRNYEVRQENEQVILELPLLMENKNNLLEEKTFEIPLAPSGQLQNLKIKENNNGKKKEL